MQTLSPTPLLATVTATPPFCYDWVIDARTDCICFIGGAWAALAMLAAYMVVADATQVWLVWALLLDTPHYFGTYSRSYLDASMRRTRPALVWGSLVTLGVGAAAVGGSAALFHMHVTAYRVPLTLFALLFNLWAFWHLVRQHHGIAALYRRRDRYADARDGHVEHAFIHHGLFAAFVLLIVGHPEARAILPLQQAPAGFDQAVRLGAWGVIAVASARLAWRQVQRWQQDQPIALPRLVFLLSVVGSYVFLCTYTPGYRFALIVWTGLITLGHNLEYHALVWFHHRNRYHRSSHAPRDAAAWVSHRPVAFMACALLTGLILRGSGMLLGIFPGTAAWLSHSHSILFGDVSVHEAAFVTALGVAMHHYFLDQFIWKIRQDSGLRRDLNVPSHHPA